MRRPSVVALISLIVVLIAVSLPKPAVAEGLEDGLTVIAIDSGAAPAPSDLDAAETALLTVVSQINAGGVALMSYGRQPGQFTLLRPGTDSMIALQGEVRRLRTTVGPYESGQFEMLSAAYSNMTRLNAPRGSRVVIVTPGRIEGESESTRARLQSLGELFPREGWQVDVVTLPLTIAHTRDLMAALAASAGGRYYDLGATDGVSALLRDWMGLKLSGVIDAELGIGVPSIAVVDVAPHTASLRAAFLRGDSRTSISLYRPNGAPFEINAPGNSVFETPNVVVYSVQNPGAGTWRLQGVGAGSKLVAGVDLSNPLQLGLVGEPPFAVGRANVLKAAATIDGAPQVLPAAAVTARVQWADGTAAIYLLNDAGAGADDKAGDGIFSVLMPAASKQGFNDVALELKWPDLNAVLRSAGVFRTEVFPAVQVTQVSDVKALKGDSATVATLRVTVGQYPHLVRPDEIEAKLVGADATVVASVTPKKVIENGKAWEFEVRAAPPASGEYTLAVTLRSEHLGRKFSAAAPSLKTVATIDARPLLLLGLPVWAWAAMTLAAAAVALAWAYLSRQVRPYGYLCDDQDHVVADFSKVARSPLHRLFTRARVLAAEVPGLPFHGGEFEFKKDGVELHYLRTPGDPSIRVNGRPAGEVVRLEEESWLGAGGRLLRFVTQRKAAIAPAAGDGD